MGCHIAPSECLKWAGSIHHEITPLRHVARLMGKDGVPSILRDFICVHKLTTVEAGEISAPTEMLVFLFPRFLRDEPRVIIVMILCALLVAALHDVLVHHYLRLDESTCSLHILFLLCYERMLGSERIVTLPSLKAWCIIALIIQLIRIHIFNYLILFEFELIVIISQGVSQSDQVSHK